MRLGRTTFESEGWQISIQHDQLGRFDRIYIYRERPDRQIELYRPAGPGEFSPVTQLIDATAADPPYEFAITVPEGFASALAAQADAGPGRATMDELRERLRVEQERVDKLIAWTLANP